MITELRWLNAEKLVNYHTLCAVYNALATGQPEYIASTIGMRACDVHQHETRRANRLTLPRIRTEAGRRRLCYRGVQLFNDLEIDRTRPFRAALKDMLLASQR